VEAVAAAQSAMVEAAVVRAPTVVLAADHSGSSRGRSRCTRTVASRPIKYRKPA